MWRELPRRKALPTLRAHEILRLSVDGAESDLSWARAIGASWYGSAQENQGAKTCEEGDLNPHGLLAH